MAVSLVRLAFCRAKIPLYHMRACLIRLIRKEISMATLMMFDKMLDEE